MAKKEEKESIETLPSQKSSKEAFTLIELLVVISILGVFFAIGYNLLKSLLLPKEKEEIFWEWHSLFQYAREEAILSRETIVLRIDLEKKQWALYRINEKKPFLGPKEFPQAISSLYSPYGSPIEISPVEIHFYPNGESDPILFALPEEEGEKFLYFPRFFSPPKILKEPFSS